MKKLTILILIAIMFIIIPHVVYAQEYVITINYNESLELNTNTNVIFDITDMLPGDKFENTVKISNNSNRNVSVYLDKIIKYNEDNLLSQVNLHIYQGDKTIFFGKVNEVERVLLSQLEDSKEIDIKFVLEFNIEAGNEFQNTKFMTEFIFGVQDSDFVQEIIPLQNASMVDNNKPSTDVLGDMDINNDINAEKENRKMCYCCCWWLMIIIIVLQLVIIGLMIFKRKK